MKYAKDTTVREVITLGADPEFALIQPNTDRVINANEVYNPNNATSIDCEFGYDGHSATGEIRPKATDTPKKAVQMIKRLLERNKGKYPQAYKYNLKASSDRISLGGHIHFGNMKFIDPISGGLSQAGQNLVHNLDNLLAFPSMYLEDEQHGRYRRSSSYGCFGDSRVQAWGFEYRTLSSFIACKELTSCVFHLGYAIADATLSYGYKCKKLVQTEGFSYAFQNQARELLRPHLNYVFKEYKKLPLYKEKKDYRENIDLFRDAVKEELPLFDMEIKKGWDIEFDIADFWKVEKLETLLEKITKLLIAIHTLKRTKFEPVTYKFVAGSHNDIGCVEIAQRVNIALNNLIDKEVLKSQAWKKLKVYGLRESRGNEVWIGQNSLTGKKRKEQVLAYLWEIASEFAHETKIEDIMFTYDAKLYSVAFGRKLREENLLIAETMLVIILLMMNKDLFQQTQKVKGKTKKLLITKHKVVDIVIKNLKNTKKFKAVIPNNKTDKLNNVELPMFFNLDKSYTQLTNALSFLDIDDKFELARTCEVRFKGVFEGILATKCISKCETKTILTTIPLIELCPLHICRAIKRLTLNLPHVTEVNWDYVFEPTRGIACEACGNEVIQSEYCIDCMRCVNCCNCYQCEQCENKVDQDSYCSDCDCCVDCCEYCDFCESHDCHHGECDSCGDDTYYDAMCSDCSHCEHCNHDPDCSNNEQDEEEPEPSVTTASSGVSTSPSVSPTEGDSE